MPPEKCQQERHGEPSRFHPEGEDLRRLANADIILINQHGNCK
jgi:hypothetical protein